MIFRQAEIEHLWTPRLVRKIFAGLDVAVDNPFSVRRVQCIGHFNGIRPEGC